VILGDVFFSDTFRHVTGGLGRARLEGNKTTKSDMSVPSRRTRGQKLIGWCVGKDSNVELGMDEGLKVVAL